MENLEIEDAKDPNDALLGLANPLRSLPFQSFTKEIKASVLKRRAQVMIIAFPIIFFLVSCCFSGLQIYWTSIFNVTHPYTAISQILYRLQDINCNYQMITDIKVISADAECEPGYQDNGIGTWNGTVAGCYHESSGTILRKSCAHSSNNIKPRPSAILHKWKGSKFCMKTILGYKSLYRDSLNSTQNKCTASPSDIYLQAEQNCPISDIRVVDQKSSIPQGYKKQALSDDKYLIFTANSSDPQKLVEFNTELSTYPCLNPTVSPQRSSHDAYPLSRKIEEGCGKYGIDNEAVILDQIDALVLYKENNLIDAQKKLPAWENYNQNEQIVFFAKFRNGFLNTPECNFCNPQYSLIPCAEQLKISEEDMSSYVMITGIVLVFQFLLVAYNIVKYFDHKGDYQALFFDVGPGNTIFYLLNVWYFAVQIIISYTDYSRLRASTEKIRWIEQLNCFKNIKINELFDTVRGSILDNSRDVLQDCLIAELIAILCAAGFLFAYKINKSLVEKEPEKLVNNTTIPEQKSAKASAENSQ